MNREEPTRRILVALDASPASVAACAAAAEIAATVGAEMVGIFVEDSALLRSAELPLTQLVGTQSAEILPFSRDDLVSQLRAQAHRARRDLELAADQAHITWSFRVTRGAVSAQIKAAAAEADLISIGYNRFRGSARLGATLAALLGADRVRLLVARERTERAGPVALLLDPSQAADADSLDHLIDAAVSVHKGTTFEVVIFAGDRQQAEALEQTAVTRLEERGLSGRAFWLGTRDREILGRMSARMGMLVISAANPLVASESALAATLHTLACPVLITHPQR